MTIIYIIIWIAILAFALVLEFETQGLVSIWFVCGSIIALILALLKVHIVLQVLAFVIISLLCLIFLRSIAKKFLYKNSEKTNLDVIIGLKTKLLEDITIDASGKVKIHDILWSVKSVNGSEISRGTYVEIVEVAGNKLLVK